MNERLYELGFQFRKSGMWKYLSDVELFAVKLKDGRTAYCTVMGQGGKHFALSVYIGEKAVNGYLTLRDTRGLTQDEWFAKSMKQDCLQCCLEDEQNVYLSALELKKISAYARKHKISLRDGKIPAFVASKPYLQPGPIRSLSDAQDLIEALEGTLAYDRELKRMGKAENILFIGDKIPCMVPVDDGFVMENIPAPTWVEEEYPRPERLDDDLIQKLKQLPAKGILECGIRRMTSLTDDGTEKFFPAVLMAVETDSRLIVAQVIGIGRFYDPTNMLRSFAKQIVKLGRRPTRIDVSSTEVSTLLEDLCACLDIRLAMVDSLPFVYEIMGKLDLSMMHSSDDELDNVMDMLDEMGQLESWTDSQFLTLHPEAKRALLQMAYMDALPARLAKRIRRLYKK